ncbi:MAG: hypothetical protein JRI23_19535 [Deltaproteobacteria bacterium]|jgi:hypothetical protein|nr:hypothetical protein [Deltaproteobacteria bacterium]MBW2534058.1 hypothetical protein [Deltaproteobacteria bacterium]
MKLYTIATSLTLASALMLLGACDEGKAKDGATAKSTAEPAAKKADEGKADDKKAAKDEGGGDLKEVCEQICDKGVECATELAKSSGAPDDVVKTAKAEAEKAIGDCKKDCGSEAAKATDEDKAQMGKVKDCLKKDCKEFTACMEKIE